MAPKEEAGEDERLLKDPPGSSDKEAHAISVGEDQENIKSNPDETTKEDCDNGGSVIEATVSSEDLNDRHDSDSNSQCAESNGACKPIPEMSSKSINGECASEVPEMRSKSSNDDNSGSTDEMPTIGTKSSSDDNSECADRSSPRAVLDMSVSGSVDSDDSASVEQPAESNHHMQWRNLISGLILRRKKSMGRAVTFPQRSKSRGLRGYLERMRSGKNQMDCSTIAPEILPEIGKWRPSWRSFDYEELCAATDRFSPEKLIGKGGHAEVYKGQLADGQFVAVKRLTKGGNKEDRVSDFLSELGIIAHVNHPNAAQLLGFSVEGGLHLVLQFSPHGSLASVLHGIFLSKNFSCYLINEIAKQFYVIWGHIFMQNYFQKVKYTLH